MIGYAFCAFILIYISPANFSVLMIKNPKNYGPFILTSLKMEPCKGPRRVDVAAISCQAVQKNNSIKGVFNVTYYNTSRIDEVKIAVFSIKGSEKKALYNNKIPDPCQHYAIGMTITNFFHTTNCQVKKGNYGFEVDLVDLAKNFLSGSFFYGEYMFKIVILNKKANLGCVVVQETFSKKVD